MCPGYQNTHERPYQMTSDSEEVTPPEGLPDRIVDDLIRSFVTLYRRG